MFKVSVKSGFIAKLPYQKRAEMSKLTIMTTLTKPTTRDALESIWLDYHYPIVNGTQWILSQDIQNEQPIAYMDAVEQFVESVAKSEELPFIFDKNFEGITLKKPNNLGELFYNLLKQHNKNVVNPSEFKTINVLSNTFRIRYSYQVRHKYEISENMEILYDVASNLNLNIANFTGNPMLKITNDGLLEGELINSFVTRLREATKRKSFKTKVDERKKESSQSFNKTKRYIERLHANSLYLNGVRMVICYQNQYANSISLAESNVHLMKFLDAFETDSTLGSPVGYWWKREYMSETSYRYYLIVFFNTTYDQTQMHNAYNSYWSSITGGQGLYFIPGVPDRDHQRCNAMPLLQGGYMDGLHSISSSIQRMFMRDIFLRLERNRKFDYFGMDKLPKLANPSNFTFIPPTNF